MPNPEGINQYTGGGGSSKDEGGGGSSPAAGIRALESADSAQVVMDNGKLTEAVVSEGGTTHEFGVRGAGSESGAYFVHVSYPSDAPVGDKVDARDNPTRLSPAEGERLQAAAEKYENTQSNADTIKTAPSGPARNTGASSTGGQAMGTMTTTEAEAEASSQPWEAVLVIEGQPSGDGRMVAPGALSWGEDRPLPLPLYFQRETPPGGLGGNPHAGALPVGVITQIERLENTPEEGLNTVVARGLYDLSLRDTAEAIQLASGPDGEGGPVRGISADLDDVDAEVDEASGTMTMLSARIMGATQCPFQALPGSRIAITDAQQLEVEVEVETDAGAATVHPYTDSNGDGTCDTCEMDQEGHDAAQAALRKQGTGVVRGPRVASLTADALTAALAGLPPEAWFGDPDLQRLTPLTITDELANGWRRIYGHAFGWRTPHTALGNVTPPRTRNGYASFLLTAQRATCDCPDRAGMVELAVGSITLGTTHQRNLRAGAKETLDHYDHTGLQVAKVAMGEDDHGGWFAGAIPPWVEEERVEQLRGATLSGDWRWIGGHRELVALLAVNTPGFPVPRGPAVHISGGRETALVAAGIVPCDGPECEMEPKAGASGDAEARLAVLESQVRGLLRSSAVVGLDAEALAVLRRRLGIVDPEEQAALVARLGLA